MPTNGSASARGLPCRSKSGSPVSRRKRPRGSRRPSLLIMTITTRTIATSAPSHATKQPTRLRLSYRRSYYAIIIIIGPASFNNIELNNLLPSWLLYSILLCRSSKGTRETSIVSMLARAFCVVFSQRFSRRPIFRGSSTGSLNSVLEHRRPVTQRGSKRTTPPSLPAASVPLLRRVQHYEVGGRANREAKGRRTTSLVRRSRPAAQRGLEKSDDAHRFCGARAPLGQRVQVRESWRRPSSESPRVSLLSGRCPVRRK